MTIVNPFFPLFFFPLCPPFFLGSGGHAGYAFILPTSVTELRPPFMRTEIFQVIVTTRFPADAERRYGNFDIHLHSGSPLLLLLLAWFSALRHPARAVAVGCTRPRACMHRRCGTTSARAWVLIGACDPMIWPDSRNHASGAATRPRAITPTGATGYGNII